MGMGSASGILYQNPNLLLIGDNSSFLYQYAVQDSTLTHHALLEHPRAVIPKPEKPDFESMAQTDSLIYVFGSGSTEKRNTLVILDRNSKKIIKTQDLTNLYLSMQNFAGISGQDFNIEGVAYDGSNWYFFQRGNGKKGKNGIFTVQATDFEVEFNLVYNEIKLPKIKGTRAGFTDAVFAAGSLYFLASAESSASTYEDGQVLGSLIGRINLDQMKAVDPQVISEKNKFEGLALKHENASELEFLLCEDDDSGSLETNIYLLKIKK